MFVGWEGVGLCSYLLIGFWFEDPVNAEAGKKAFITNRVGDAGFLLGIFLLYDALGTLGHGPHQRGVPRRSGRRVGQPASACSCSSARPASRRRFRCYVWLPDAMAGPTPVSALIHAATMVTAGVYMIARLNGLYLHAPEASMLVAWVGAATAFFAATVAIVQTDIKKVLAYSTISQLGFMFVALGVGAYGVGGVPPADARLLQGVPVPRRGQRDPRAVGRAGHPQDGRLGEAHPDHLLDLRDRDLAPSPACRRCRASSRRTRSCGSRSRASAAARCC